MPILSLHIAQITQKSTLSEQVYLGLTKGPSYSSTNICRFSNKKEKVYIRNNELRASVMTISPPIFADLLFDFWGNQIGDRQVIPFLISLSTETQTAAIQVLASLKDLQIIPLLQPLLYDTEPRTRITVMKALAKLDDPQVIPLLSPFISNSSRSLRIQAARLLEPLIASLSSSSLKGV